MAGTAGHEGRNNAFGALRLTFASLVIVSHVPELVDGDRSREILTRLTGTTSFGELAVEGFFIISGFLITGSLARGGSVGSYLFKRAARIYPAFVVASLLSLLVAAPLAGTRLEQGPLRTAASAAFHMAVLARPMVVGAFPGQHHNEWGSALNGATWTIQYEFACYLLVIPLVRAGLARRPAWLAGAALLCLAASGALPADALPWAQGHTFFPVPFPWALRLGGMFLAGAAFRALGPRLAFRPALIATAAVGLAVSLRMAPLAGIGMALFGGYLIFGTAELGGSTRLARINNRNDISYGVYLYGWPVQRLLMRHLELTDLLPLALLTWLIAVGLGWASWLLVEKPTLRWARARLSAFHRKEGRRPADAAGPPSGPAVPNRDALPLSTPRNG